MVAPTLLPLEQACSHQAGTDPHELEAKSLVASVGAARIAMAPAATDAATAKHHATSVKEITLRVGAPSGTVEGRAELRSISEDRRAGTGLTDIVVGLV